MSDTKDQTAEAEVLLPASGLATKLLPTAKLDTLPEKLAKACAFAGWTALTPVQSLVLPYLLKGADIMAQSRTGSGKTGCYLLPMLEVLDPRLKKAQALVLAPTRELASQVEREAQTLFQESGLSTCAIYGGVGYKRQLDALQAGCQVVIGTPGRILDHLMRHTLNLEHLRYFVFDEADRMLSIGFYPDIQQIAAYLPPKRQTSLFSATYPPQVMQVASEFLTDPVFLSLSQKEVHVAEVEHLFCLVKPMDKDRALVRLLETENPASAIIFCNTKSTVHYLAEVLKGFGYNADELAGDISQKKREVVLGKIRQGSLQYLVATDVAARGIDIPQLSHVFLYEPPQDMESYIHRAGRTGRAGAAGTVISLVDFKQKWELDRIARFYKINLREIPAPSDEEVAKTVCSRLNALLSSRMRSMTGLESMRANRYLPLAKELLAQGEDEEERLAILAMLLDDYHRQILWENHFPRYRSEITFRTPAKKPSRRRQNARRGTSHREKSHSGDKK